MLNSPLDMFPGVDTTHGIEQFSALDLADLRRDLLQSGIDSFQAAELVTSFLSGRGYGISNAEARGVVLDVQALHGIEPLKLALKRVARVV